MCIDDPSASRDALECQYRDRDRDVDPFTHHSSFHFHAIASERNRPSTVKYTKTGFIWDDDDQALVCDQGISVATSGKLVILTCDIFDGCGV